MRKGHRYRTWRANIFKHYGHVCHLCGHGGAWDADHLKPHAQFHDNHTDYRTGRPAHGVRGCPTCGVKCNQSRGDAQLNEAYERELD